MQRVGRLAPLVRLPLRTRRTISAKNLACLPWRLGATGSGISTTVDLLMGLLEPNTGKVLVVNIDINSKQDPEKLLGIACWDCPCATNYLS